MPSMLLPDPPQLHGTHNHLEHYRVAERLGVIAAAGDEHARPADELLFFHGAVNLTKDFSDGLRLRLRNDDFDEIRRLHAQVIVLRFWKAVLHLAFHFDVAVRTYPVAPNGLPRGPALDVIDA